MERFAAEGLQAERDAHIKAAFKAKVPWPEIMESFGLTLAEIMAIAENQEGMARKGSTLVSERDDTPPSARREVRRA